MNEYQIFAEAKRRFRAEHEKSYPQPERKEPGEKPTMQAFWQNRMVWIDFVIVIAAALTSALRTFHVMNTVGTAIEGVALVVVIEGTAAFITFFLVLENYRRKGKVASEITGWMLALVLASIGLALLTNLYSMMLYQDKELSAVEWAVFILAGSIAVFAIAVLSHILGTIYVDILNEYNTADERYHAALQLLDEQHKAAIQAWADEFERMWNKPTTQRRYIGMVNAEVGHLQERASAMGSNFVQPSVQMNAVQARSNVHLNAENERPIGFSLNTGTSKPEQVAVILRSDPSLASKSYSDILKDERIAAITSSKGTISTAFTLFNQGE